MNSSRPRLLLLACAFPPSRAVGAIRSGNLAKQLVRLGWDVTVATVDPGLLVDPDPAYADFPAWCREAGIRVIPTGLGQRMLYGVWKCRWWERPSGVRKLSLAWADRLWRDIGSGWTGPVRKACAALRPGDVDLIMASGPPFLAFESARQLSRRLSVPLVLDYRDLWSMSPHDVRPAPERVVRMERRLVEQAVGITVISNRMAQCLDRAFGCANKLRLVTNGFDPAAFRQVEPTPFVQPTVVYAGSFYPPLRVIDPVVAAIAQANRTPLPGGREIRLLYLGGQNRVVEQAARERDALRWVDFGGRVSRGEVLSALKGALAAAVITSVEPEATPESDSILTGKLFEAMGAGARVLMVAPAGSEAAQVVERTRAGKAFAGPDVAGMAAWLRQLAAGSGAGRESEAGAYSWPEIARRADAVLREWLPQST